MLDDPNDLDVTLIGYNIHVSKL